MTGYRSSHLNLVSDHHYHAALEGPVNFHEVPIRGPWPRTFLPLSRPKCTPQSLICIHRLPTSLALLAQALRSVELLSSLVKPGTRLLSATSDLQGDIFEVQQVLGSSATAHQRFLILNPIRQKSLLFPLFEYPSLLSDYCRRSKDSELYPLLYLAPSLCRRHYC